MRRWCLIMLFVCAVTNSSYAQDTRHSVRITITGVAGKGDIFVSLVDRKTFGTPYKGVRNAIIHGPSEEETICFTDILAGRYGVRCFQDVNGNKELDRGLLGPQEPWALSWQGKRSFPPSFDDIAFSNRDGDVFITLRLDK